MTSPRWDAHGSPPRAPRGGIRLLAICATGAVFVQLVLGALTRHSGAGLAIPDFPLAFGRLVPPFDTALIAIHFAHRLGAVVVSACVLGLAAAIMRHERRLAGLAGLALVLLAVQIALGASIIWTQRAVVPTTTHLVVGAALLATCLVTALRASRLPAARPVAPPLAHAVPA